MAVLYHIADLDYLLVSPVFRSGEKLTETVNLAEHFANSERFKSLFQDGMGLVEESASYLDGPGRETAKALPRGSAMLYGAESMRLTTRLMQNASWLLLQRAANEQEMTREQLMEEKKKIRLERSSVQTENPAWSDMPVEFTELVSRSIALQNRVMTLDAELYGQKEQSAPADQGNPVSQQIELLSTAFGAVKRQK